MSCFISPIDEVRHRPLTTPARAFGVSPLRDRSTHQDTRLESVTANNCVLCKMSLRLTITLLTVVSSAGAGQTLSGWRYGLNITHDSGGAVPISATAMRYEIVDHATRTDIERITGQPPLPSLAGSYTLTNDADSSWTTVIPSMRAATIMMNPTLVVAPPTPSIAAHGALAHIVDLGDGGPILGHATRHFRVTQTDSAMVLRGRPCMVAIETRGELWVAPDVELTDVMRDVLLRQTGLDAGLPAKPSAAGAAIPPGLPLRIKLTRVPLGPTGEPHHALTVTAEFTELTRTTFAEADFRAPADYAVTDVRARMAARRPSVVKPLADSAPAC